MSAKRIPPAPSIEIPPEAARAFVRDVRAYHRTKDKDKRVALLARQAEQLSGHAGAVVTMEQVRELFQRMR